MGNQSIKRERVFFLYVLLWSFFLFGKYEKPQNWTNHERVKIWIVEINHDRRRDKLMIA